MKRFAAFVFAFFAVCYLQLADADAQFRRECRYGFCVPGGGPSSTPVSNACINSSGTTITFTAQGIGNAKPNRVTVVTINWDDSTAAGTAELTAMTVGGISMTRAVRAVGDNQSSNSEIWYVANPTGTSANIVATFSTAVDGITIEVYSLIGYDTVAATQTGTTTVTQAYDNKQLAIAAGSRRVNVSTSLSNMQNDFSSACGANLWGVHASQALHGNGGSLTTTINPTSNTPLIALAKWSVGFSPNCTASTNFIARTSGMSSVDKSNYDTLICGLVTDGVFAKLDVLHIYAAPTSTIGLLNLVKNSSNGVTHGSPTFTAYNGFTGVEGSSTVYIDMQYVPSVDHVNFTLTGAHTSIWATTNLGGSCCPAIGLSDTSSQSFTNTNPRFSFPTNTFFRMNGGTQANVQVVGGSTQGHWVASRTASTTLEGSRNGANIVTSGSNVAAITFATLSYASLASNDDSTISGNLHQLAMTSIGGALSATDVTNFYNRLRTYMTAVGVP